jgi:hypothetical protein
MMLKKSANHGEHGDMAQSKGNYASRDFRRVAVVKKMSLP